MDTVHPSELLGSAAGVDSGTTIMAMTFDGGVVLGADSRTSTGARRARAHARPTQHAAASRAAATPPLLPPRAPSRRLVRCKPRVGQDHGAGRPHLRVPLGQRRRHAGARVRQLGARQPARAPARRTTSPALVRALCFVALQAVSDYARRFLSEHALDKGAPASVAAAAKILRT